MLGTNDLKQKFSVPPVEIGQSIALLLDTLARSAMGPAGSPPRVLLVAPVPVEEVGCLGEMFTGAAGKSRSLAPLYAAMAARFGADFLDAGEVIAVSPVDGIHFDAAAHAALGHAIAAKLTAMDIPRSRHDPHGQRGSPCTRPTLSLACRASSLRSVCRDDRSDRRRPRTLEPAARAPGLAEAQAGALLDLFATRAIDPAGGFRDLDPTAPPPKPRSARSISPRGWRIASFSVPCGAGRVRPRSSTMR